MKKMQRMVQEQDVLECAPQARPREPSKIRPNKSLNRALEGTEKAGTHRGSKDGDGGSKNKDKGRELHGQDLERRAGGGGIEVRRNGESLLLCKESATRVICNSHKRSKKIPSATAGHGPPSPLFLGRRSTGMPGSREEISLWPSEHARM